jgi:hypothetical protein
MKEKSELVNSQNQQKEKDRDNGVQLISGFRNRIPLPVGQENVSDVHLPLKFKKESDTEQAKTNRNRR